MSHFGIIVAPRSERHTQSNFDRQKLAVIGMGPVPGGKDNHNSVKGQFTCHLPKLMVAGMVETILVPADWGGPISALS